MSAAIHCEDLVVHYRAKNGKTVEAVRGLSFEVQPGEIVGFLGPNGAGKSSTLKVLMGFVAPVSGKGHIFGQPCGTVGANRRVGYLPEVAMYYPYLTPRETLQLYGELQGLGKKGLAVESMELLELVGLSEHAHRQNRLLSKGQLQRVGIAQSLLGHPDLLILDEVTSGIDPIGRHELRTLLLKKRSEGCTLFFSSHELSEVESLCDRVLLIHQGRLIESHELGALKSEIGRYVLTFRTVGPVLLPEATLHRRGEGVIEAQFSSKADFIEGLSALHMQNHQIIDVQVDDGNLEDYFVDTIRRAA